MRRSADCRGNVSLACRNNSGTRELFLLGFPKLPLRTVEAATPLLESCRDAPGFEETVFAAMFHHVSPVSGRSQLNVFSIGLWIYHSEYQI